MRKYFIINALVLFKHFKCIYAHVYFTINITLLHFNNNYNANYYFVINKFINIKFDKKKRNEI